VMASLLKVLEFDLVPSLFLFAIACSVGSFYFFMTCCLIVVTIGGMLLTIGYSRSNYEFVTVGRIVVVFGTCLAFLNLFGDD